MLDAHCNQTGEFHGWIDFGFYDNFINQKLLIEIWSWEREWKNVELIIAYFVNFLKSENKQKIFFTFSGFSKILALKHFNAKKQKWKKSHNAFDAGKKINSDLFWFLWVFFVCVYVCSVLKLTYESLETEFF